MDLFPEYINDSQSLIKRRKTLDLKSKQKISIEKSIPKSHDPSQIYPVKNPKLLTLLQMD